MAWAFIRKRHPFLTPPVEPIFGVGLPLDGYDLLIGDCADLLDESQMQALVAACDVFARFTRPGTNRVFRSNVGFVRVNWALNALRHITQNAHVESVPGRAALERIKDVQGILAGEVERRFPAAAAA